MALDSDAVAARTSRRAQTQRKAPGARFFQLPSPVEPPPEPRPDLRLVEHQTEVPDDAALQDDPRDRVGKLVARDLPDDFVTADALSEQGSAAEALHSELAGIRDLLDQPLPPIAPHPSARRPGLWMGVAILIVLIALLTAMVLVLTRDSEPNATAPPAPAVAGGVQPGPFTNQVAGLPTSGPGIDSEGAVLGLQVLADRNIAITEQAILPSPGSKTLTLMVPRPETLTGDAKNLAPVVKGLEVTIDGTRVVPAAGADGAWVVTAPGDSARTVLLHYRLENAVAISQPSSQNRALAVVTPLLAQLTLEQGQPAELRIPADGVGNVVCLGVDQADSLCRTADGPNWDVTIPDDASSAAVLLQLDL